MKKIEDKEEIKTINREKPKNKENLVYLGADVGMLKSNMLFPNGDIPLGFQSLIKRYPILKNMIVGESKVNEIRRLINNPHSKEAIFYNKTKGVAVNEI